MPVGPSYVEGSRSSRRISPSSSLVAVTGIGRVCGTSASSAPSVTSVLDAELLGVPEELGDVRRHASRARCRRTRTTSRAGTGRAGPARAGSSAR